jgi:hypothetical protein
MMMVPCSIVFGACRVVLEERREEDEEGCI